MKMTDDEVFAVLDRTERLIDCSGAFGLSEYQCEQRTVDARRKLREVRDYLSARLAADQQKGGGEVDRERTLTAARFRAACYALKEAVEGASGEVWRSESGDRLKDRAEWVAFYNLTSNMRERGGPDPYATPQPSIPAPAQQDGKASGREATDAMAKAMLAALNDPFNQWHTQIDRMKIAYRAAYLAHPPQADQEPQS